MNRTFQTPPVVLNLIIINVLVYMATALLPLGKWIFGFGSLFWVGNPLFHTYQFVTYMFLHANFEHVFFNMFALWMFGRTLEYELGSRRFLVYYMVCGIGAALIQMLAAWASGEYYIQLVGASGAVMGLLLAFGVMHPNAMIAHPAHPDEGQVVRHHLRRHRALPGLDRLRRQRGPFRPRGRHVVGIPAAPLLEAARKHLLLISDVQPCVVCPNITMNTGAATAASGAAAVR